jgi:hypothetical protein
MHREQTPLKESFTKVLKLEKYVICENIPHSFSRWPYKNEYSVKKRTSRPALFYIAVFFGGKRAASTLKGHLASQRWCQGLFCVFLPRIAWNKLSYAWVYLCIGVCIHVCMYRYKCVPTYVCICAPTSVLVYLPMYLCLYLFICVPVYLCLYLCIYVCTYVLMHVFTFAPMYLRLYLCVGCSMYLRLHLCI